MIRMTVIFLLCATACGGGAYMKAAGDFANTTSEEVTVLNGVTGFRGALCHKNAQFDYAFHRMNGPVIIANESDRVTLLDYETRYPFNATTWSKLCAEKDASDKVIDKVLLTIAAYASAMKTVADVEFKGTNVASLGTDASALIQGFGASQASNVAKSLVNPIKSVASALGQHYAAKRVADVVAASDASITKLFDGIDDYLAAVADESKLVRHSLGNTLRQADQLLQPTATIEYVDLAVRWSDDLDSIDAAIAASQRAAKKLSSAQTKLRTAGGSDDAPALKDVLADLTTVLADIQAVRTAIAKHEEK